MPQLYHSSVTKYWDMCNFPADRIVLQIFPGGVSAYQTVGLTWHTVVMNFNICVTFYFTCCAFHQCKEMLYFKFVICSPLHHIVECKLNICCCKQRLKCTFGVDLINSSWNSLHQNLVLNNMVFNGSLLIIVDHWLHALLQTTRASNHSVNRIYIVIKM